MLKSRRNRVIAVVCAVTVVGAAVAAVAAVKPKAGKWKGSTTESNAVTFTVVVESRDDHQVHDGPRL